MKLQSKNYIAKLKKLKESYSKLSPEELEIMFVSQAGKSITFEQFYERVKESGTKKGK